MKKIHLETLDDFHAASNLVMDAIKHLLTEDFTEEENEKYIHGDFDEMLLILATLKLKREYTFSKEIITAIGPDDELFN